jgi:diketogulonate reductase-like aldo/keto reductase
MTHELLHGVNHIFAQLGLSYVDMYLVHFPALFSDFESGWQEFEKMKKDGLTRCALFDLNKIRWPSQLSGALVSATSL